MSTRHSHTLLLLTAVVVAFGTWAAIFEIEQTVRAQGQLVVGARTQVLQAADAGVLTDIRVKEGQSVVAGQLLAVLEQNRSRAGVQDAQAKLAAQQAALTRLNAEAHQAALYFPNSLSHHYPQFVLAQKNLFIQRKAALEGEIQSLDRSVAIARQELQVHQRLFSSGDVASIEVMQRERQVIDLELRRRMVIDKFRTDAINEIIKIEEERASTHYRLDERQSVHKHTEIRAPMAGIVKYMRITTEGGVLRQGDEILQISPADEESLIEVKLNPADIGLLKTGMPTGIRLDAFDSSFFGTLNGQLTYISPDTLTEQGANGQSQIYYRVHVRVDWENTPGKTRIQPLDLKPGMSATVDIRTGARTVLAYLFKPIHKAFSGALTER